MNENSGDAVRRGLWAFLAIALLAAAAAVFLVWNGGKIDARSAVTEAALAAELRESAVNAGAQKLELESFKDGDDQFRRAVAARSQKRYRDALDYYREAGSAFKIARLIASAQIESLIQAETLQRTVTDLGVEPADPSRVRAEKLLQQAVRAAGENDTSAALQYAKEAVRTFNKTIARSPRRFTKGSTAEEIRFAIELCRRYTAVCDPQWYETETTTTVALTPFRIDPYEITNREFARFVEAADYTTLAEKAGFSYRWDGEKSVRVDGASWRAPEGGEENWREKPDYPVAHIAHDDAVAYCQWKGGRLPNEAEWEYAARGVARNRFPWGNEWDETKVLWASDLLRNDNKPVGSYGPAIDGARGYDFAGSVWEWTAAASGGAPVLKGGSWLEKNPANFRAAAAKLNPEGVAQSDDGFRCVMEVSVWEYGEQPVAEK